ncbi:MAG: Signal peptidase I [Microgenomates group bacterium GW2011_GWA1_48_10]|uniref:Signal peptidase I n=1 Tax=Candidatus Gottesmanbacteria bacterium RIFCSPHIGHO2_01_FULL_47_48 TaxID=1798381 RepID=A0A1F6A5F9_9BACT|nr:MAG: Signal peptidase I [Microgenomates group bacterium GW2011_GWA1_48_10]OGG19714.1 MAG: signal peptidase I [Candidatus Gottesmanbacteria bacterium RIFCSPHIGHO2_01_FULL_47_48]
MDLFKKLSSFFWDILESITFALAIFVVAYLGLFQTAEVVGASSYPTLKNGERYVVDKISYRFNAPQRGDFVVIRSPRNPNVDFIKRVVGLPGETIRISAGKVYINGSLLPEPYLSKGDATEPESFLGENEDFVIPENHLFIMGDNRANSSDSRDFGPVTQSDIIGKFIFKWWPPDEFGAFP